MEVMGQWKYTTTASLVFFSRVYVRVSLMSCNLSAETSFKAKFDEIGYEKQMSLDNWVWKTFFYVWYVFV